MINSVCVCVCVCVCKLLQECPTLCDPMDYTALQAPLSTGFSNNTGVGSDRTRVSCLAGRFFTIWKPNKRWPAANCFPGAVSGKEPSCQCRRPGFNPGRGRPPGEGNGNPLQYSCLEHSMDREAWQVKSPEGRRELDMTQYAHPHVHGHTLYTQNSS